MDENIKAKNYLTNKWVKNIIRKTNGIPYSPIQRQQNPLVVKLISAIAQVIAGPRAWVGEKSSFILGGADFIRGVKNWHLLELNGGSSRCLQCLDLTQWRRLVDNIFDRVNQATNGRPRKLLVGHLDGNRAVLLVDKLSIAEVFKLNGWEVTVLPYNRITPDIALSHDFILGDGVTRRLGWNHNLTRFNVLVANTIAHTTDSKLRTYRFLNNGFLLTMDQV